MCLKAFFSGAGNVLSKNNWAQKVWNTHTNYALERRLVLGKWLRISFRYILLSFVCFSSDVVLIGLRIGTANRTCLAEILVQIDRRLRGSFAFLKSATLSDALSNKRPLSKRRRLDISKSSGWTVCTLRKHPRLLHHGLFEARELCSRLRRRRSGNGRIG